MTAVTPPLGRCMHCGHRRALSAHRSRRDGLWRLLCTPCWSEATGTEEHGETVDWRPGYTDPATGTPVGGGLW